MTAIDEQVAAKREHVHRLWAALAPQWAAHAENVDAMAAQITERLIELAAPRPGEEILELACGAGGLGLALAPLVAPGGQVVLSDVAPGMVSAAEARARARGLLGVSTRVLDMEQIECADASLDAVVCREGLMFAVHPATACHEIQRVLRPGGRLAAAVWGAREDNPWLGLLVAEVEREVGHPVPPPGILQPVGRATCRHRTDRCVGHPARPDRQRGGLRHILGDAHRARRTARTAPRPHGARRTPATPGPDPCCSAALPHQGWHRPTPPVPYRLRAEVNAKGYRLNCAPG